jgi:hypothetical protein
VTVGAKSFLIRRIFCGGDGHCNERRSLLGLSENISHNLNTSEAGYTNISWSDAVLQLSYITNFKFAT